MAGIEGQQIGPYRLVRLLGRGGFADVWLAERSGPGGFQRQVALKLVVTTDGDVDGDALRKEALLREARLVSWLDDPAVVSVEAADAEADFVWMAMEFCDGGSLNTLLRRLGRHGLPMPPSIAVSIARDAARALAAAHHLRGPSGEELCVVHRDLKPGNILLSRSGGAKVCDFGIAKATDETNVTGTGMLKGTVSYVAPELWENVRAFSPASDAFALGTLLVEMLTMERLHAGGAMPIVYRRIVERTGTEDAELVEPYLPDAVPLVAGLMERDPDRRTSDMRQIAEALEALLSTLPPPTDVGLLLELLEHVEGRGPAPRRPVGPVGHAWAELFAQATGEILPLVPGPGGAGRAWKLARGVAAHESGSHPLAQRERDEPVEEISLDGTAPSPPVDSTLPWPMRTPENSPTVDHVGPVAAKQEESPPPASSGTSLDCVTAPMSKLRPPPAPPSKDVLEPKTDKTRSDQTLKGATPSPARRRRVRPKRRRPLRLVPLLLAIVILAGLLVWQLVLLTSAPKPRPPVVAPFAAAPEAREMPVEEPPSIEASSVEEASSIEAASVEIAPTEQPVEAAQAPPVVAASSSPAVEAASPAADVAVEPALRAAPTPHTEPAATRSTAAPEPVDEPAAAAPPPGCLVVTSRPGGAFLWVGERMRSERVRSRSARVAGVGPGTHQVGMSLVDSSAQASATATVKEGAAVRVHCDLLGAPRCRVETADVGICGD